jgi:hypothetical protein
MSAIEHRDWQEVDEPEIYREERNQLDELECAKTCLLSGDLSHFERPAQILGRPSAGDNLDQPIDHRAS